MDPSQASWCFLGQCRILGEAIVGRKRWEEKFRRVCVMGAWDKAADKLRQLVKGMSLGYGLGVGGELRDWASFEGKKILELPREVGDRFFGVFFSGACILTMRDTLAEFCRGKLDEQIAWFRGLVTWLFTSGGLLFLCICTVLHACFAKPFFERIPNSTVEEAYVHVHKIANELEMYANDVQLALNCDARGMELVRATPILVPLKLRLRVIFLRM